MTDSSKNQTSKKKHHSMLIALVFDEPAPLANVGTMSFPEDATAEWETRETLLRIESTWKDLGFQTVLLPLDQNFLPRWVSLRSQITLVHTVVEGWGSASREGWIPSLCELSGVPFIGAGPSAQNVAMKKSLLKLVCGFLQIPTAEFHLIRHASDLQHVSEIFLSHKHFIKPDAEGSGMGIDEAFSISESRSQTEHTVESLLTRYPDGVLLEKYLPGAEFTSALIGKDRTILPIAQVEVESGVYGLANKSKEVMGEKISFPKLPTSVTEIIRNSTLALSNYLGFHDFVRMDWKMNETGEVFFLEANPLAGLSHYYSVLPRMAQAAGLSYATLLGLLAESALLRVDDRSLWYGKARLQ